jgi:hypothetical protein
MKNITQAEKYHKVLSFGKIDYNHSGRRNCKVTIEVELRPTEHGTELSICGNIWNPRETDIYSCGQNIDTIAEYIHSPKMRRIKEIWEQWHLNGMRAGTPIQEKAVKEWRNKTNNHSFAYTEICEYLKSINLYEVDGYKYGSAWLMEPLPQDIIDEVLSW